MTKPERFAAQKRIKEENRHKILRLLNDKPRTFKELVDIYEKYKHLRIKGD